MKIWSKGFDNAPEIDAFTVGKDRELDLMLAPWDILGTMAHITMLSEVGLLGKDELAMLLPELEKLHQEAVEGRFTIEGEDVHSEVEARLTAATTRSPWTSSCSPGTIWRRLSAKWPPCSTCCRRNPKN